MAFYMSPIVDVREIDLSTTIPAVATSIGVIILRNTWKGPEKKPILVTIVDDLINTFGRPTNYDNPVAPVPGGTGNFCAQDMLSAVGFLKYGSALYCSRVMPSKATFAGTKGVGGPSASFEDFIPSASVESGYGPYTFNQFTITGDPDTYHEETGLKELPFMTGPFNIIAYCRGAWGNNIRVAVVDKATYDDIQNNNAHKGDPNWPTYYAIQSVDSPLLDNKDFLIIVQARSQVDVLNDEDDTVWSTMEVFNVSTDEQRIDDTGSKKFVETIINDQSNYIRISLAEDQKNQPIEISTNEWQYFTGGTNGGKDEDDVVTDDDIIEILDTKYANPESIDINILIDSNKSVEVKREMITICQDLRKDCMAVLDCPRNLVINNTTYEAEDLRDWRRSEGEEDFNVNTSYAAMYSNWLEVYDKWNGKYRWIPASGFVAGIYANTDNLTDPWWAPAGLNRAILNNVRRLAWNPTKGERDILYKNGLNPIVSFSGQGKVIWGQKTMLDKESAFNRVNVRRLFIVLEKAVSTAAKYFLFEPNDEMTRMMLINMIDPFLRDVRARRGVYDFYIVCDERNNTPERIDRNELWCDIYIKPTRAAEFIVLNFIATKTGASFTELAAAMTTV